MVESNGIVCAYVLNAKGGGHQISPPKRRKRPKGLLWVHLQRTGPEGRRWLYEESGLDPVVCDALFGNESLSAEDWITEGHPRSIAYKDGVLINLRGINLNPGADRNDMVAIRAWLNPDKVITVRQRHIVAFDDIRASIATGNGPKGPGDFLVMLAGRLVDRIADALVILQESVDKFQESDTAELTVEARPELGTLRRRAIAKRRHIIPQREALLELGDQQISWLNDPHRTRLALIADRTARQVQDLENLRERTAVIQDEVSNHLAAKLNKTMYTLSIVAAIFLPIGFLTGLFGINLGGIPGRHWEWSFTIACAAFGAITVFELWLFRRLKIL